MASSSFSTAKSSLASKRQGGWQTDVVEGSSTELIRARDTNIGLIEVQRSLPTRARRSVGAWCFADHLGPLALRPAQVPMSLRTPTLVSRP